MKEKKINYDFLILATFSKIASWEKSKRDDDDDDDYLFCTI